MFLCLALFAFVNSQTIVACNYERPVVAVEVDSSGLPCSEIYDSALTKGSIQADTLVEMVMDINTLSPIDGRRCFKLSLSTSCRQKWFSANEITRYTDTKDVKMEDCYGSSVCMNCEISSQYLPEDCRTFTFGQNIVSKEVTFGFNANIYANKLGVYTFSGITSTSSPISLGGVQKEKVYFNIEDMEKHIKKESVYYDRIQEMIIIPHLGRLMFSSKKNETYMEREWTIFDNNNYVRMLNSTKRRVLSQQQYSNFYLSVFVNITGFKMRYLDCRIKNLMLQNKKELDLSYGEIYKGDKIEKYECHRVQGGLISQENGCLVYGIEEKKYKIKPTGELTNDQETCIKNIRLNKSHIMSYSQDTGIHTTLYEYPSLEEEEIILKYPPKIETDLGLIQKLLLNQKYTPRSEDKTDKTTTQETKDNSEGKESIYTKIGTYLTYLCLIWLIILTWWTMKKEGIHIITGTTQNRKDTQERELGSVMVAI